MSPLVPVVSAKVLPPVELSVAKEVEPVLEPLGSVGLVGDVGLVGLVGLVSVGSVVGPTELESVSLGPVVVGPLDVRVLDDPVDEELDPSSSVSVPSPASTLVHPPKATLATIHNKLIFIVRSCQNTARVVGGNPRKFVHLDEFVAIKIQLLQLG